MTTPSALTYNSLLTDIATYAERNDDPFITQIPRFVMLAENRIASEVHSLGFQRVVTGVLTSGNQMLVKPERWRETKSFFLTESNTYLQERTLEYCRLFGAASSSTPRYYADYDYEHYFLAATPSSALAFELKYHERPEPLSDGNQTNWTTQYAPQLLLYATLLEAQPFLKLPERISEFQALYDRAVQAIAGEDVYRAKDKSAMPGAQK